MTLREDFMRLAIDEAMRAPWPFGAVIVEGDKVIASAGSGDGVDNSVDPTAHAEINAIRAACKALNAPTLEGRNVTLYASCEPCIMCMSAIWYAGIEHLVYGTTIGEEQTVFNWKDLPFPSELLKKFMGDIRIAPGFLKEEVMAMYTKHATSAKFRHEH